MRDSVSNAVGAALCPQPVEPWSARRVLLDLVLWAATAAPFAFDLARRGVPAMVIGVVLTAYVVLTCRRLPVIALLVAVVAALVDWRYVLSLALAGQVAGRRTSDERVALAIFPLAVVGGSAMVLSFGLDPYDWALRVGGSVVFGLFPWLVGLYRKQRDALVRMGWERAARLEEQQRIVVDQARLRERARIAHDMHDFLGHHLSLAALHAGALEVAEGIEQQHAAKAGELRSSIATATEQLREITSVLRDESDPLPVAPADGSVRALVDSAAAAGVDVRLEGEQELDGLESMHYRAVHRMAQETLTNAAKHAPGAAVCVRVSALPDALEVRVSNGPATEPVLEHAQGSKGLVGLRERAKLSGGTLESGPVDGGGFAVTMRLPRGPGRVPDGPEDGERVSEAERDFRRASGRARRSLVAAVLGPTVAGTLLVLTLMGIYAYDTYTSVLTPEEYRGISVGESRPALAGVLPEREIPERGTGSPPPRPRGADCAYYRSTAGFLPAAFDIYRICFRDGNLVDKDVIEH